jgi:hypothetical protein
MGERGKADAGRQRIGAASSQTRTAVAHVSNWQASLERLRKTETGDACPTLASEVRWMELRDWLKRASDNSKKPVKQISFAGERFDVMSVRRRPQRVLGEK